MIDKKVISLSDDEIKDVSGGKKPKSHKYPYLNPNWELCGKCKWQYCIKACEVDDALYIFGTTPHCDHKLCNGCGSCANACPYGVLEMEY